MTMEFTIALGEKDIVKVSYIQYDIQHGWFTNIIEPLGRFGNEGSILSRGKGNTLADALQNNAENHVKERAERLNRNK